jgi:hypothetical protein
MNDVHTNFKENPSSGVYSVELWTGKAVTQIINKVPIGRVCPFSTIFWVLREVEFE